MKEREGRGLGDVNLWVLGVSQFVVSIYGGFFSAGIGILMLAELGLVGLSNIHQMNGLKSFGAVFINAFAALYFAVGNHVRWPLAAVMAVGAIFGGYGGAWLAQRIGQHGAGVVSPPGCTCSSLIDRRLGPLTGHLWSESLPKSGQMPDHLETSVRNSPGQHQRPPPEPECHAVWKGRRYEQVAEQIQRLIASGALSPGDRLPPERELAAKFGVGRSSLRDAIRTLEVMGIVESRHGSGTVVRDLSTDSLVVPLASVLAHKRELVAELLDVRRMIEPALAARAAANATEEELSRLEDILQRQAEKVRRGEPSIEEDSEFHYTIALAARNSVVLRVLDVLMDLLRESRARSLQVPGRTKRSCAGHQRILWAIKRRDGPAAEAAVRKHLKEIEEVVTRRL